jgi:hypothetical protein
MELTERNALAIHEANVSCYVGTALLMRHEQAPRCAGVGRLVSPRVLVCRLRYMSAFAFLWENTCGGLIPKEGDKRETR